MSVESDWSWQPTRGVNIKPMAAVTIHDSRLIMKHLPDTARLQASSHCRPVNQIGLHGDRNPTMFVCGTRRMKPDTRFSEQSDPSHPAARVGFTQRIGQR
jgi:hypothetical protein